MKSYFLLILFSLSFGTLTITAQDNHEYCGTTEVSPWFDHYMENRAAYDMPMPEEPIYIPLTVHVLGTDEGTGYFLKSQVFDALCTLNEDFASTNLQFFLLGNINYIDNTRWYDHEEYEDGYDMMRTNNLSGTVNCYIVQNPAGNCGYYAPAGDAVALNKGCMSPSDHTWAHELGHFFSLPHTFRGWEGIEYNPSVPTSTYVSQNRRGIENVVRNNCNNSADRFCDTPADYLSYRWPCDNQGFSTVTQTDRNGDKFRSDGTLFMSYASDRCQSRFSTQQVNAMLANLNSQRRELFNNEVYPGAVMNSPEPIFPIDEEVVEADNAVLRWSPSENATHYHVQASRLPNLGGLLITDDIVTDTFFLLPELTIGRTYYWRVRAYNNFDFCTNPSSRNGFVAAALTSNKDMGDSEALSIYPNPVNSSHSVLRIDGLEETEDAHWTIFNINGQRIMSGDLSRKTISLDAFDGQKGTYTVVINTDNKRYIKKLVITD